MSKAVPRVTTVKSKVSRRTMNLFVLENLGILKGSNERKSVLDVAERLVGLHAKRPQAPYLSLYARLTDFSPAELDRALYRDRTLLRAHCMRGTVHMLPLSQYRSVLTATKGQLSGMYRRAFDKLEGKHTIENAVLKLIEARGPMTRSEMADSLPMNVEERDLYRIVNELCTNGALVKANVNGSWRSGIYYYELLHRWQPLIPSGETDVLSAQTELVGSYLAAYAPATIKDISWWTGLNQVQVKNALSRVARPFECVHFESLDCDAFIYSDELVRLERWRPARDPHVTLLPSFDPYVIAYADRHRYIDIKNYSKVFKAVSGIIEPVILLDGRIVGTWKYSTKGGELPLELFKTEAKRLPKKKLDRVVTEMMSFLRTADMETGWGKQDTAKEE
jgi:hypothetical protein